MMGRSDRVEGGVPFEWVPGSANGPGHWKSLKGNEVEVFPPASKSETVWKVRVIRLKQVKEVSGSDAEEKAFAIAKLSAK
ncbi:MAG: hypothetical protein WCJ29_02625 [bacterium]